MKYPRIAHTSIITNDMQFIIIYGGFYKNSLKNI